MSTISLLFHMVCKSLLLSVACFSTWLLLSSALRNILIWCSFTCLFFCLLPVCLVSYPSTLQGRYSPSVPRSWRNSASCSAFLLLWGTAGRVLDVVCGDTVFILTQIWFSSFSVWNAKGSYHFTGCSGQMEFQGKNQVSALWWSSGHLWGQRTTGDLADMSVDEFQATLRWGAGRREQ